MNGFKGFLNAMHPEIGRIEFDAVVGNHQKAVARCHLDIGMGVDQHLVAVALDTME